MDFDQLHTFLEIVRLGSFSRAAESCYRSQPAVSAQIRQMEEELGAKLFDRVASRVTLTVAGKRFAEYAREILELRRRAMQEMGEINAVPRGELVIGANEASCLYILPKVFAEFKKTYPEVQISIFRTHGAAVVQRVMENALDFGIAQLPVQERKLERVVIHTDEIVVLAPAAHPLARTNGPLEPEALTPYPLLLPKAGRTRTMIDEYLGAARDNIQISMELESSEMLKRFVQAGLGISFIVRGYAQAEARSGAVKLLTLRGRPAVQVGLIYRKDKALSRAALAFIEVATRHTAEQARA
jgi:DNA-binding transcriptional LysR family regulator